MTAAPMKIHPELEGKITMIGSVLRSMGASHPKLASSDAQALLETLLETRSEFLASSEIRPSAAPSWEPRLVKD